MAPSQTDRRVLLGHISTAHGIRGEVLIKSYAAEPESIAAYGPLTDNAGTRTFKIKSSRLTPKGVIARIEGVNDRNAAEALRGVDLYVSRDRLPETGDAEFYHTDLIGLIAETADGQPYGRVASVQNFGAGDLLEIERASGGDTEYLPFTNENVPVVDIANGKLTVVVPTLTGEPEPGDEADQQD